jgi:predicted nuclease of predicted toxin-antitoxin system
MIIADENIDASLIDTIRKNGFEVLSIRENFKGLADKEIINLAKSTSGVLITEDKDFGKWVFAHNMRGFSVIFLRYEKKDITEIAHNLLNILKESQNNPSHSFYTITKNKTRNRLI